MRPLAGRGRGDESVTVLSGAHSVRTRRRLSAGTATLSRERRLPLYTRTRRSRTLSRDDARRVAPFGSIGLVPLIHPTASRRAPLPSSSAEAREVVQIFHLAEQQNLYQ